MKHQDWEHESAKDYIYLLEEMEMLKAELEQEFQRSEAIIKTIENPTQHADKQVANIQGVTSERLQSGSDVPSESDK